MAPLGTILRLQCDSRVAHPMHPWNRSESMVKIGTGFLVRINGTPVILTAHHVVSNAVSVTCTTTALPNGEPRPLTIVGYNPYMDVAQLSGPDDIMQLPAFVPRSATELAPRTEIVCGGFGGGTLRTHTTTGTVTGRNSFPHNRFQIDAAVNPGNSGGPVLHGDDGRVVGVVTSGEDDMQSTNFFAPMDEAYLCIRRIMRIARATGVMPAVDLGFTLSAIVRSVSAAACDGRAGGALVVAAPADDGTLRVDDVITAVADADGRLLPVNAQMRVRDAALWAHDDVDFRTLLDAVRDDADATTWTMQVRRAGGVVSVSVPVGASRITTRTLRPDCEPMRYVVYGGVVCMTRSVSHRFHSRFDEKMDTDCVRTPDDELLSRLVVVDVVAGSPFHMHALHPVVGLVVVSVHDAATETTHPIATLDDFARHARHTRPTRISFESGHRIGASRDSIDAFDGAQSDVCLRRGVHDVLLGIRVAHTHHGDNLTTPRATTHPSPVDSSSSTPREFKAFQLQT